MTADSPLLSLIIPLCGNNAGLPALLESALRQSLKDMELILVEDASQDSCSDILEGYRNKGLKACLLRRERRLGLNLCRFTGLERARGRIIAFAEPGGVLHGTSALERHAGLMLREGADMVHFSARVHAHSLKAAGVSRPLAAALRGQAVFERYVNSGCRGGLVNDKLYARKLCLTGFNPCRDGQSLYPLPGRARWGGEDFVLSSWFLFHARQYQGSPELGYEFTADSRSARVRKAAGCMADLMFMAEDFIPYLAKHGCPAPVLDSFFRTLLHRMEIQFYRSCDGNLYRAGLPMPEQNYAERFGDVPPAVFCRALHYLLFLTRDIWNRKTRAKSESMRH